MKDCCISFVPIRNVLNTEQVFCKISEEKFNKLKKMFSAINSDNKTKIVILIDTFTISDNE